MIHQYKLNGYNIVLDVYSGSVHVVDDVAYDIIGMYEGHTKEEITKAILEKYADNPEVTAEEIADILEGVEELKKTGKLFTEDLYADIAANFKMKNNDIKALCLHVAHTCNLTCDYCFASQGKYQGERALMSFEVGKQALEFPHCQLWQQKKSGSGLFRRRTPHGLGCGETAGKLCPQCGKRTQQKLPFHTDYQRSAG